MPKIQATCPKCQAPMLIDIADKEEKSMPERQSKKEEDCLGCLKRDWQIEKLTAEAAKHAEAWIVERKQFQDKLAQAPNAEPQSIPTLASVIEHCESGKCENHAKEWQETKAKIITEAYAKIPKEIVHAKASELHLIPTSITIKNL